MNRNNRTELVKLAMAILLAAFLWQQVTELRKARGSDIESIPIEPRWMIQLLVTENDIPVELIEFFFASYEGCRRAARDAKKTLGLDLFPACLLRWVELDDED